MKIITKYLLTKYIKYFFIVLISLELFFVGIDFFQNYKDLPQSANLQLLYILYNGFFTLTLALPLSLVFAWIITIVVFIKSNEHVAFLSLGITYKRIITPIVIFSLLLLLSLISLQATPLAYSYSQKDKILNNEYFSSTRSDLFLKYNEYMVYMETLLPLEKKAENVHIYKLENDDVKEMVIAKKAYFQNNKWYVVDAKVFTKPSNLDWETSKLEIHDEKFLNTLNGFRPKILDGVYETSNNNLSIIDAFDSLKLLKEQNINTDKIRSNLYYQLIVVFFIIPLLYIIYSFASINSRFFNVGIFVSISVLLTLVTWGIFFILNRLSMGGVMSPEILLLLPMLLFLVGSTIYYRAKMRFN